MLGIAVGLPIHDSLNQLRRDASAVSPSDYDLIEVVASTAIADGVKGGPKFHRTHDRYGNDLVRNGAVFWRDDNVLRTEVYGLERRSILDR